MNRNASYEFKYVIDGTFVNEPEQILSNGMHLGNENGVFSRLTKTPFFYSLNSYSTFMIGCGS
jgi:hypothetical protein